MNTNKLMNWFNPETESESMGTILFLTAAMFMVEGVERGLIYDDDVVWWAQAAQRSNSYGEAVETYEVMKKFEELMKDEAGRVKMATMMSDLSTDPSMDYDFWYNGSIGLVDLRLLIEGLTTAALKRMEEVKSFRQK